MAELPPTNTVFCNGDQPSGTLVVARSWQAVGLTSGPGVSWFAGGARLPAGRYRISYVEGAVRYSEEFGYGVDTTWWVCTPDGRATRNVVRAPSVVNAPPLQNPGHGVRGHGWATQAEAESANRQAPPAEFDHTDGPLGLILFDSPYADNADGSPAPTWLLEQLVPCAAPGDAPGTDPAFEVGKCGLPFVPRIPTVPVLPRCVIAPAAQPISECVDPGIPPPPPEVPPPPCPQVTATTSVIIADGPPSFTLDVTQTSATDDCGNAACQLNLGFQLQLPAPFLQCPTITAGGTVTIFETEFPPTSMDSLGSLDSLGPSDEASVIVNVTPVDTEDGTCGYQFDFDFQLPSSDGMIPVTLVLFDGVNGGMVSSATWRYTAYHARTGVLLGILLTPLRPRPLGTMAPATAGIGYHNNAGAFVLSDAYETPGAGMCLTGGG